MTMLIGFAGKKGSGKNTAANQMVSWFLNAVGFATYINEGGKLVVNTIEGEEGILDLDSKEQHVMKWLEENVWGAIKTYSFADPLKEFCINVFGLTHQQCYGSNEEKNTPIKIEWSDVPGIFTPTMFATAKERKVLESVGMTIHQNGCLTARDLMQVFGTNICRKMVGDCWVNATINRVKRDKPEIAIITDVRFPNEADGIKANNGQVVKFTRAPFVDTHESELALDNYSNFDVILDNKNMTIAEQAVELKEILKRLNKS